MNSKNKSKRFAGVIGKDYEVFQMTVDHNFQEDLEKFLRDFTSKVNKKRIDILEIGTGTGITTAHILESDDRTNITSVDNEKVVLNQAKENLKEDSSRINFVYKDALKFLKEEQESSFDGFVSAFTIHNFDPEYRKELFPEIFRILRPGGLFINADKYANADEAEHEKALEKQIKAFDMFESIGKEDLKKAWTEHYIEDDKIKITDEEQIDILKEMGFVNPEIVFRKDMEAIIRAYKPKD